MPREIYLVSTEPMTMAALVEAAVAVDGQLVPRVLFDGAAIQLVDVDDVAVITLELSRRIEDPYQLELLVGRLPLTGAVWWTEATAPWGRAGEAGVRVARELGDRLGARVSVEDGT
jgi:hypothetical protein